VAGIQAKDPAKKEAALAKLTPATLMQSCNEQLADFFKDMKSSEREIAEEKDAVKQRRATGEAFVHASKYLVRLLDAAQILADKFAKLDPPVPLDFALLKAAKVKTPKELMAKVESVLLALRKSSTVPADAKGELGVDEARAVFGVADIGAFRKLISDFGVELNQQVRRNPDFKAELAVDQATERQYFGVPEIPPQLKALLEAANALTAPLGDETLRAAIGEADGEAEAAQELLDATDGTGKVPAHLKSQIEDCVIRAEQVLAVVAKADAQGVLARAATVAAEGQQRLGELEDFDDADLHDAYKQDIEKAIAKLADKVEYAQDVHAELQNDLQAVVRALGSRVVALKKRMK